MAVPASMTTLDLSGHFQLNKHLSDSTDEVLKLQGVGWVTRKVISGANINLYIKHFTEDGVEKLEIEQVGVAGKRTNENRSLTWEGQANEGGIFGPVIGKTRRAQLADIEQDWQKEGWVATATAGGFIQTHAVADPEKAKKEWTASTIWGIAEVNGENRYVRKLYFTGPKGEIVKARMVYDYVDAETTAD